MDDARGTTVGAVVGSTVSIIVRASVGVNDAGGATVGTAVGVDDAGGVRIGDASDAEVAVSIARSAVAEGDGNNSGDGGTCAVSDAVGAGTVDVGVCTTADVDVTDVERTGDGDSTGVGERIGALVGATDGIRVGKDTGGTSGISVGTLGITNTGVCVALGVAAGN